MFALPETVDPRNSKQACAWQACYRFSLHDTPLRSRLLWILDGRTSRFGSGSGDWESNGALGVSRDEQREVVGMRKVGSPPERVMRLHMNSAQVSASWGTPGGCPTNRALSLPNQHRALLSIVLFPSKSLLQSHLGPPKIPCRAYNFCYGFADDSSIPVQARIRHKYRARRGHNRNAGRCM